MPDLKEGQFELRGLVMGEDTPYFLMPGTGPWSRQTRTSQSGERPWGHGSWAGAEWAAEVVVPFRIRVDGTSRTPGGWLESHQHLAAAFRPVGAAGVDEELKFCFGGREYAMYGRPRMIEPATDLIKTGYAITQAAFVALDPRIYAAAGSEAETGLAVFEGGLAISPLAVPFSVPAVRVGGSVDVTNEGTAETSMVLIAHGPVEGPRITVRHPDGSRHTLRVLTTIAPGETIEINTLARTVLANGLAYASQRGRTVGTFPTLPPGTSRIDFRAAGGGVDALLHIRHASAWW